MLFRADVLDRIATGEVTSAVRRWKRPTVREGGTLTTRAGVLAIDSVDEIEKDELTDQDARAGGFDDVAALLADRSMRRDGRLVRVSFHLAGEDPRIGLREQAELDDDELSSVRTRLDRWDRSSSHGPWTRATLELIGDHEGVRAADLASRLGRETQPFKTDVRKLKSLGLTESLEVGYRLSPRGRAVLAQL